MTIETDDINKTIRLVFEKRPPEKIIKKMHEQGFRFKYGSPCYWWARISPDNMMFAEKLKECIDK